MNQRNMRFLPRRSSKLQPHPKARSRNEIPPRNIQLRIHLPSRQSVDDEFRHMRFNPFLRRTDRFPHDETPTERTEKKEIGADVVESTSVVRNLEEGGDFLLLRFEIHQRESYRSSGRGDIDVDEIVRGW